ncbi:hypothetical protein C9374_012342 [Naegleria lovaniensis]|uniref:Uncharacterized protein n=1 Tax=Naegleria lovaniensis TaxID=51637 RepID=A0AA88GCM8_NAELO|nr:uncharacterized protein C9374_012342 [Naegleria lovaniensis]KAG2373239.1 hypothetical protein C9374_012342 [Naegleria lovaniensis]
MVKHQALLSWKKRQLKPSAPTDFFMPISPTLDKYQQFMNRYCYLTISRLRTVPSEKQGICSAGTRLYQQIKDHPDLLDAITDIHSDLFETSQKEFTVLSEIGRAQLERKPKPKPISLKPKQDQIKNTLEGMERLKERLLELKNSTQDEQLVKEYEKDLYTLNIQMSVQLLALTDLESKSFKNMMRRYEAPPRTATNTSTREEMSIRQRLQIALAGRKDVAFNSERY